MARTLTESYTPRQTTRDTSQPSPRLVGGDTGDGRIIPDKRAKDLNSTAAAYRAVLIG
jgi:hypothetical protein